jgi:nucleotide-binding universal stress UspA family protein
MAESASTEFGVLVGIDGSAESHTAVRWAAEHAVLHGRPVTLMHIVSPMVVTWPIEAVVATFYEWQDEHAARVVEQAKETLTAAVGDAAPPDVAVELRHDGVVVELTTASEQADLLVIGSRGLGPVGGAVLGSVSRTILHHAHCPVVIVKEGVVRSSDRTLPVLLGIDGSPASENATAFAFDEASRRGVDLVALHAWSDVPVFHLPGADWHDHEQDAHEILGERLAGWQERYPDVVVHRRVVGDKPALALIDECAHAQLVVVGSRGRGGISSMLLGSVSAAVAESAMIPVAVIRS